MQNVILAKSYGDYNTYAATTKNAMSIFNAVIENLDKEIIEIAKDSTHIYMPLYKISKILLEVLDTPEGEVLEYYQKLCETGLKENKTKNINSLNSKTRIQELALLMVTHNITKENLQKKYNLTDEHVTALQEYSLLKELVKCLKKPIKYIQYEEYLDIADDYKTIVKGNWKVGVEEFKIARHILNFVNQNLVDTSDQKYQVISYEEEY